MSLCQAAKKMEFSIISQVPGLQILRILEVNPILQRKPVLQRKEKASFKNLVTLSIQHLRIYQYLVLVLKPSLRKIDESPPNLGGCLDMQ